jgi:hypothetical protein
LCAVDKLLKRLELVLHVFDEIERYSSLVAVRFVVEVYRRGLGISINVVFAFGQIAVNSLDAGETFHAELGDESAAKSVEILILFLSAMPDCRD